eukprot:SAG22_NODE_14705_length_367_cov_0.768657_1_plen_62_part_01
MDNACPEMLSLMTTSDGIPSLFTKLTKWEHRDGGIPTIEMTQGVYEFQTACTALGSGMTWVP